ncbi:MAG: LCP family protein [Leptolyngbyaceae cyanobacterium SM1_1_3]|nr:LCP family protein [Leptolyngbyaceae cyanobacterium SM1_1_3]NJN04725.1 LCP family protein [Leptolyngbyaceae cyanobacterium RM1_1_2]NJO11175.1 LCP family protein [Leptolyngbyaceae cyanobacterium SL_1_1]
MTTLPTEDSQDHQTQINTRLGSAPETETAAVPDSVSTTATHPEVSKSTATVASKLAKGAFWGLACFSTAIVSAALGAVAVLTLPLPAQLFPQKAALSLKDLWQTGFRYTVTRPVNILVMGIDEVPEASSDEEVFSGRTDTMLLVRVDPTQSDVNVLSIPRDTRVTIPGWGKDKINQANVEGGALLAGKTVSATLNQVEVDRYVRVSTGAFREIVDLVGGVEVFVPKPMYYEDRTQDLVIDLEPGWQTLNGDQAEQFARFRQDAYGDIGRVQRQQTLIKALRSRLTSPTVIPKLPQIVRILQRYIDTNLTVEEMLALANFSLELEPEELHMVMLPGRFSEPSEYQASYWIMDDEAGDRVMQEFFQTKAATLASAPRLSVRQLHIAIQNASGEPHVANEVARYLAQEGLDNLYVVGDWPDVVFTTQVIAQRGDLDAAERVSDLLGIGHLVSDSTGNLESDLTVRIGKDWLEQRSRLLSQTNSPQMN